YFYLAENTIDEESNVFFTTARLRALRIPLALYWGKEDHVTPLALAGRIRRAVPGTIVEEFQSAGHALHIENVDELLERLARHAGRLRQPRGRPGNQARSSPGKR